MYAVVKIGGKQYRVKQGEAIDIENIPHPKTKKEVIFNNVLLAVEGKDVSVGQPTLKGAKIRGEIQADYRAKKIVTYKYKRRKSYHRTIGHRQYLTRVLIKEIILNKQQS